MASSQSKRPAQLAGTIRATGAVSQGNREAVQAAFENGRRLALSATVVVGGGAPAR